MLVLRPFSRRGQLFEQRFERWINLSQRSLLTGWRIHYRPFASIRRRVERSPSGSKSPGAKSLRHRACEGWTEQRTRGVMWVGTSVFECAALGLSVLHQAGGVGEKKRGP